MSVRLILGNKVSANYTPFDSQIQGNLIPSLFLKEPRTQEIDIDIEIID